MLVVGFINKKNQFTGNNSYLSLFFILFLCMFPGVFNDSNMLFSNLFILFAFRRIVNMRSGHQVKLKILDASIWVCIATLFYPWAALFFILVFTGIFLYGSNDLKNILIPFVAVLFTGLLTITYLMYFKDLSVIQTAIEYRPELHINKYRNARFFIPLLFMLGFGFISTVIYVANISRVAYKSSVPVFLLLVYMGIALTVGMLDERNGSTELIFLGFPLTLLMVKYLETVKRYWLKELYLWLYISIPLTVLILGILRD
ncbi:hypothetical protein DMZ48_01740 [Robertkochia solimangrovi]|nr:hypothetical protein DMZ48_01740 [Robertkochia solimangrovi]